jgi:hypothetical protein
MSKHILKHEPKRENFQSEEEYEEALAFFKHRTKHLLRASPKASQSR